MKTGIKSSAYFHLHDYEQGFKTLRAHGYDAVDYQEFISMDSPLYSMGEDELSCFLTKVASAAEENGMYTGASAARGILTDLTYQLAHVSFDRITVCPKRAEIAIVALPYTERNMDVKPAGINCRHQA